MILVANIQALVAKAHGIEPHVMTEPDGSKGSRLRPHAWPRQEAMFLCRDMTAHSLPRIGYFFGNRHHTTVLDGVRRVEKRLADPEVRRRIDSLSVGLLLQEGQS